MSNPDEIRGADFSFARIPAALLIANNVHHVFRYLAWLPNGKVILPPEYADDIAHGLTVHLNWETTAQRPLSGAAGGHQDGAEAARQRAALGSNSVIITSYDSDPNVLNAAQIEQIRQYFEAFSQHVPVGIYAGSRLIDISAAWPFIAERWQPAAWSGQYLSPHADYYQRIGHSWRLPGVPDNAYDEDVVIHGAPAPAPPPPPAPVTKGHAMTVNVVSGLVKTTHYGFGQCVGVLDAGQQVRECLATVHGPDPHAADPSSPDDFWHDSINAVVRAQVRGNKVVVTVSAPFITAPVGGEGPAVHTVAFV